MITVNAIKSDGTGIEIGSEDTISTTKTLRETAREMVALLLMVDVDAVTISHVSGSGDDDDQTMTAAIKIRVTR